MNLNCVIIDDEPLAQELIRSYVEKTPFLNLKGVYSNAIQAMKGMPSHVESIGFTDWKPDII